MTAVYHIGNSAGTVFVRQSDGAFIPEDPLNADYQAVEAWIAAGNTPDPYVAPAAPSPMLTFLQFMALFTQAEQDAIVNSADTQTKLFMLMATGSGGLQLSNAEVITGVNYLAATPSPALIAPARVAQILAGTSPSS